MGGHENVQRCKGGVKDDQSPTFKYTPPSFLFQITTSNSQPIKDSFLHEREREREREREKEREKEREGRRRRKKEEVRSINFVLKEGPCSS